MKMLLGLTKPTSGEVKIWGKSLQGNEKKLLPRIGYEAKSAPKQLWIVPGAAHAVSYKENKEEYTRKVKEFTDRYIH